jgi:hypothetical protein
METANVDVQLYTEDDCDDSVDTLFCPDAHSNGSMVKPYATHFIVGIAALICLRQSTIF